MVLFYRSLTVYFGLLLDRDNDDKTRHPYLCSLLPFLHNRRRKSLGSTLSSSSLSPNVPPSSSPYGHSLFPLLRPNPSSWSRTSYWATRVGQVVSRGRVSKGESLRDTTYLYRSGIMRRHGDRNRPLTGLSHAGDEFSTPYELPRRRPPTVE